MRSFSLLSLLVVGTFTIVGCAENATSSTDTSTDTSTEPKPILTSINTNCPIMGGEVTDDGGSVDWDGKTVGFCCPGCVDDWNDLSDDDKSAKLASASSDPGDPEVQGDDATETEAS